MHSNYTSIEKALKILHLILSVILFRKAPFSNEYSCTFFIWHNPPFTTGRVIQQRRPGRKEKVEVLFSCRLSLLSYQLLDFWFKSCLWTLSKAAREKSLALGIVSTAQTGYSGRTSWDKSQSVHLSPTRHLSPMSSYTWAPASGISRIPPTGLLTCFIMPKRSMLLVRNWDNLPPK